MFIPRQSFLHLRATSRLTNLTEHFADLVCVCPFSCFGLPLAPFSRAAAQIEVSVEMPGAVREAIGSSGGASPAAFTPAASSPAALPEVPAPHRVVDKTFVAIMGALRGTETMRFTSRKLVLDNAFAAGAPWVTHVTLNRHLAAQYAGVYAAELFVTCEIKKRHSWLPGDKVIRKFWWAYPATMTAIHVKNGIGNMRTKGPGGCTSMECEMELEQQMQ